MNQLHLHKLHNKWLFFLYWASPLICTSCITNDYCTEFHSSSAQIQRHLDKLHNKWISYCVPPLIYTSCITKCTELIPSLIYTSCLTNEYCTELHAPLICTSCITNDYFTDYCTEFYSSSVQCHLDKLHNKWILYCVSSLICITNE